MYCSDCGAENPDSARVCRACGKPALASESPAAEQMSRTASEQTAPIVTVPAMTRPGVVTLLAVFQFINGGGCLLIGVGLAFVALSDTSRHIDPGAELVIVLALLFAAYQLTCGYGLLRLRQFARVMQIISSIVGLLAFPIGTIISIVILLYLNRPGAKVLFLG